MDSILHAADESYRDAEGRDWPILVRPRGRPLGIETTAGTFSVKPTQSGMTLSGEIRAAMQGQGVLEYMAALTPAISWRMWPPIMSIS